MDQLSLFIAKNLTAVFFKCYLLLMSKKFVSLLKFFSLTAAFFLALVFPVTNLAAQVTGAIYTTDSTCSGTDLNIYGAKDEVYLNGGPAHPGASGLPDGEYYVQVTEPNGTLLGTSVGAGNQTPVVVTGGEFEDCYQLTDILIKVSDNTPGYDTTTNPAGEYKVWISTEPTFTNSNTKTDNFKIDASDDDGDGDPDPESGTLNVLKFYDANANGVNDDGILIDGWKIRIQDGVDYIRYTPVSMILAPDSYTITESMPLETNWMSTTDNPVIVELENGETENVEFGNLCTGTGGGHTKGFWSNKNGESNFGSDDLALLVSLNLRNENGSNFDPASYSIFKTWISKARAVNMSYMLSAQLSAMELNVNSGFVNGSSLVYAPGTTGANSLGFITISNLMAEANTELGLHGNAVSGTSYRDYQEALKNALDNANNNINFVQATPCPFTFN